MISTCLPHVPAKNPHHLPLQSAAPHSPRRAQLEFFQRESVHGTGENPSLLDPSKNHEKPWGMGSNGHEIPAKDDDLPIKDI